MNRTNEKHQLQGNGDIKPCRSGHDARCPHRNARRKSGRRGFALMDVLVGGILLSIALVSVMGVASAAMRSQLHGEDMQTAAMMLDEVLNEVLAVGPARYRAEFPMQGEHEIYDGFSWELDIQPPSRDSGPYEVTATAFWVRSGSERTLAIPTRIAPLLGDEPDPEREPEMEIDREF